MLSAADNELMCRVGPGSPMGDFLREYWIPALCPDDLTPDGPPQRMRAANPPWNLPGHGNGESNSEDRGVKRGRDALIHG